MRRQSGEEAELADMDKARGRSADAGAEHAAYLDRRYFPGLDGIRCFAVIAVIWHHARPLHGPPLYERGHFGVDLFFILSGFLISTLLIRERGKIGRISLRHFWARRALRLIPAYYLLLLIMGASYLILKPGDEDALQFYRSLPIYALYLSNWIDGGVGNLNHTLEWTALEGAPRLLLHVLATLFVLSIVLAPSGASSRFLELRPIRYLGTISYGLYLYHMLCQHVATMIVGGQSPALFPATLALTICVAAISYWAFEARLLALRHRFRAAPTSGQNQPAVPSDPLKAEA